jgi:hypothetical protein
MQDIVQKDQRNEIKIDAEVRYLFRSCVVIFIFTCDRIRKSYATAICKKFNVTRTRPDEPVT